MFGGGLGIGLSGGQLNPAVTVAQWILGRKTVSQVFVYSLAQLAGSFGGSALAYANYQEAINNFDGGHRVARGVNGSLCFLVTCPAPYMTQYAGILDQAKISYVRIICLNQVMMIGMSYGVNDGYPINPARDLGARLFALFIYGKEAFTDRNYWFWIPIVGPLLGGVIGALFYNVCFGFRSLNMKEIDKEHAEFHSEQDETLHIFSCKFLVRGGTPMIDLTVVNAQKERLRQQVVDSERNLKAHQEAIPKMKEVSVLNFLLNSFSYIDSLMFCFKFLNSRVKESHATENFRLHILYLINDWAHHCAGWERDGLSEFLERKIVRVKRLMIWLQTDLLKKILEGKRKIGKRVLLRKQKLNGKLIQYNLCTHFLVISVADLHILVQLLRMIM
uniref:MFS domain-containing protein n=1 Tax=Heterorhabditis bacteriophora TaxID=37862 RepID=A0A1I7X176_HETBA